MDEHTCKILEFSKIKEEIISFCMSSEGLERLKNQPFYVNREELSKNLSYAVSMREALESGIKFPNLNFPDIEDSVVKLKKHVVALDPTELAYIGVYCRSSDVLKQFLKKSCNNENLKKEIATIPDTESIAKFIFKFVDKKGKIRENNIPELKKIVGSLRKAHSEAEKTANGYLRKPEYKFFWQSDTATVRDGRIVLPLKFNYKGRIKGISHEISSSGQTIFFEPADLVDKNNKVIEEQNRYQRELRKVLANITGFVRSQIDVLENTRERVGFMDSFIAKAHYAIQNNCRAAGYEDHVIKLLSARHPLLKDKVVPISISIGEDYRMLIVTGPNTGGKTVTLKTVGLLALMNQFGMEIPAGEGSAMGVFTEILGDIGDEQSIEQSLSTFSSHITNIARIISRSNRDSLVLLDELGAGTDPEEGVAIAMALLDMFYEKGCLLIATTHHGILKNYGYSKRGVENASMDFNEETLEPTFNIQIGIPGESHALEIAKRNGLPDSIIDRARKYIDEERSDISVLIKNLSDRQRKLITKEKEQLTRERELKELKRQTDLKNLKLKQEELQLRQDGLRQLKSFLKDTRREVENEIRRIKEEDFSRNRIKNIKGILERIERKIENEEKFTEQLSSTLYSDSEERGIVKLREGMHVFLKNYGRDGKLVRREKNGKWLVEMNNVKIAVDEREITKELPSKEGGVEIDYIGYLSGISPSFEIDVRGKRLEEAIELIRKQLDRAILAGMSQFSIIHGKGTGVLRKGIEEFLKKNEQIKNFHHALPEDGGFGKTIVHL